MPKFALALLLLTGANQHTVGTKVEWFWSQDTPACSVRQAISADGTTFVVSRTPVTDRTTVSIEGREPFVPTPRMRFEELPGATVTFEPGGQVGAEVWMTTERGVWRNLNVISDDPGFVSKFSAASAVEIAHEKIGTVRAPFTSVSTAADALRNCENSKMKEWGVDPVAWRALKAHPIPLKSATPLLTADDYPRKAIKYGLQGWVIARLQVGPDGSVKDCKSINRAPYRGFRDTFCYALKRRARFQPARDFNGNAVAAPYVMIVRFQLS